jgi:hypothetical protein
MKKAEHILKLYARPAAGVVMLALTVALALSNRGAVLSAAWAVLEARWIVLPAMALFLVWNLVGSLAWRELAEATSGGTGAPSLWRLARLRFQGQALNLLVPAAGEVARAAGLAKPGSRLSIVFDLVSCAVAEAVFAASAILLHPTLRPRHAPGVAALVLLMGAIAGAWAWLPALGARLASRFAVLAPLRLDVQPAFRRAVGWHVIECVLGAGEIWLFSAGLGLSLPLSSIYFAAAAVRTGTTIVSFIPGQIGVAEGSLVWAMTSLGHAPAVGLALAFARRARQFVVIGAGTLSLLASGAWNVRLKGRLENANSVHPAG